MKALTNSCLKHESVLPYFPLWKHGSFALISGLILTEYFQLYETLAWVFEPTVCITVFPGFAVTEKAEKKQPAPSQDEAKVDVSRLDLRIGRIVSAEKHPDADSLYVEQVDVGEAAPRTVVSGLVKHIPLDKVQLLCSVTISGITL